MVVNITGVPSTRQTHEVPPMALVAIRAEGVALNRFLPDCPAWVLSFPVCKQQLECK